MALASSTKSSSVISGRRVIRFPSPAALIVIVLVSLVAVLVALRSSEHATVQDAHAGSVRD